MHQKDRKRCAVNLYIYKKKNWIPDLPFSLYVVTKIRNKFGISALPYPLISSWFETLQFSFQCWLKCSASCWFFCFFFLWVSCVRSPLPRWQNLFTIMWLCHQSFNLQRLRITDIALQWPFYKNNVNHILFSSSISQLRKMNSFFFFGSLILMQETIKWP